jgi:hypothetical protein
MIGFDDDDPFDSLILVLALAFKFKNGDQHFTIPSQFISMN